LTSESAAALKPPSKKDDDATIDVVINVPKNLERKRGREEMEEEKVERAKSIYGINNVRFNITVIPTQLLRYNV